MQTIVIFVFIAIAVFGGFVINACIEYKKAQNAPVLTVSVYMVRKYRIDSEDGPPSYYAQFALQDGKVITLDVKDYGYQNLPESGSCVITYKYKTLLDFQYLGAIDEKANAPIKKKSIYMPRSMVMIFVAIGIFLVTAVIVMIITSSGEAASENNGSSSSVIIVPTSSGDTISAKLAEAYTADGKYFLSFKTTDEKLLSYEVSEGNYRVLSRLSGLEGTLTTEDEKFVSFALK